MKFWSLLLLLSLNIFSGSALAQTLETYEPPALFDTKRLPKPEQIHKKPKLPVISRETNIKNDSKRPEIKIKRTESKQIIPPSQETASPALVDTAPMVKPKKKPKAPITAPLTSTTSIKTEVTKPKEQGVVKGPKTMPAVKKQGVAAEVTFETPEDIKPLIQTIEPAQTDIKETAKPLKAVEVSDVDKNKTEWIIEYNGSTVELSTEDKAIILEQIVPLLDIYPDRSLDVISMAKKNSSKGLNADRRLALSRALEVRGFLLDQTIAPNRINVRALGKNNGQPDQSVPTNTDYVQLKINQP